MLTDFKMVDIENNNVIFKRARWFWFRVSETEQLLHEFWEKLEDYNSIDFAYAQFEETEEHGLHLQGYAYSKKKLAPTTLQSLFQDTNHAYGNLLKQRDIDNMSKYCKKEETRRNDLDPLQFGKKPAVSGGFNQKNVKDQRLDNLQHKFNEGMNELQVQTWAIKNDFEKKEIESACKKHQYALKNKIKNQNYDEAKLIE